MDKNKVVKSRPTEQGQKKKKVDLKKKWQKPVLEDVSGKVMAQPYIRFT